ncbi:phosphoethanolamine transferase [Rheinheimera baltica]|uniref:phosphoethanolamine transferase n=1 Tax=Rheinheimera baltica TaxID=67576 RepID=UPI00273FF6F2|nr:phosphoethanolamine--lipid A transferase [Rheinheimera baltica]MDP5189140.1 phosphoethanolamine--lipid A transferase [Rheinheimera baltica]
MPANTVLAIKHTLSFPKRPAVSRGFSTLAMAVLLTLAYNQIFVRSVWSLGGWSQAWPLLSLLFLVNVLLCQLLSIGKIQKIWLFALVIIAAASQYFMQQYGVLIDKGMLQNALETDNHEAMGLLNIAMLPYFSYYLLLPGAFLLWTKHRPQSLKRGVLHYLAIMMVSTLLATVLVVSQYQNFAPALREHRDLKHQAVPFNAINAAIGLLKSNTAQSNTIEFQHYAEDARLITGVGKPQLVIMVLGETVRADHLGINGYHRNTTPKLAQRKLVNFGAIDACGTATAVSVPCLFSHLNRADYDETTAKSSDNVLDVMQRVGVNVIWRDNNSGCKGMCDRVPQDQSFIANNVNGCNAGDCADTLLLNGLPQKLLALKPTAKPVFVVLHQQGNHGPEYYKRSWGAQKQFLPECESNLLTQCPQQHIINAYDNAILATDDMLDATIQLLETLAADFDTALLYVSDHGESLGENGVYLHGLPYWMAPEAQTKVPMLMWFSEQFKQANHLTSTCLEQLPQQALSHNKLFDSILSLMQIQSRAIRPEQDLFSRCAAAQEPQRSTK